MARDQLAGKEMDIGRFYMKKRDFIGAINRFKVVVTQYQTTREVEEALERLTEAYISLGIIDEAQTAAAVLGHNFPDSPWYKDAYKLVKSAGGEPNENKESWISRAFKKIGLGSATGPDAADVTADGRRATERKNRRMDYPSCRRPILRRTSSIRCWLASPSATSF